MRLADCFIPIFARTARLPAAVGDLSFEQVRKEIDSLVASSEEERKKSGAPKEEYEHARLAVLAWIDETMGGLAWEGALQWRKTPLQRVHCGTRRGGALFFERLELISPEQKELREVFVLCLLLGFRGRYGREADRPLLARLKKRHLRMLGGEVPRLETMLEGPLFPDAQPLEAGADKKVRPRWRRFLTSSAFWFWSISMGAAVGAWLYFFLKLKDMSGA